MYQIAQDTITAFNGLGAGGANFANVMQALTPVINTAGQIAQTAINARNNQNPNPTTTYTGGNTYTPTVYTDGNTNTYTPTTASATESKEDWTPWIVGGAILGAGLLYFALKK